MLFYQAKPVFPVGKAQEKNTPPTSTPIAADIFITPQSLRKVKKDLWQHLN